MDTIQLVEIKNILNQQLDNEAFINTIDCLNQSDIPKVFDTKISEESEQTIGETLLAFLKNNNIYKTLGSDLDVEDETKSRRFQTLMQLLSCVSSEKRQDYIAKVMAEQAFQLDAISYKPAFLIDSSTIPALQEEIRPALLETWAELFSGIELTYPNATKSLLKSTQKFLEQYTIYEKIKPELAWFQDNMPSLFKSINPALPGFETDIETSFQALLKYGLEEAEKKNPFPTEAVSQAIKLLSKLSPHPSIYNILKFSESKWQNDILMMAAYYLDNDSVVQLLQIIRQLPPNQQTEIVNKTNDRDWTALCCATLNQKVMPAFIDYIKTLSPEYQAAILGKKGNQGANVLLLAAKNAPNTVPELLALISRLDFKDSQKIIEDAMDKKVHASLVAFNEEKCATLAQAIQTEAKKQQTTPAVKTLLKLHDNDTDFKDLRQNQSKDYDGDCLNLIKKTMELPNLNYDDNIKSAISNVYMQCKTEGKATTLKEHMPMMVIHAQQDAIEGLVKDITRCSLDGQTTILSKVCTEDGYSPFLFIAKRHAKNLPKILEAIQKLNETVQANILKQATKEGWNALTLVAENQPKNLPKILEAIQNLDGTVQADILKQTLDDGWNALMIVARYHPDSLPKILKAIQELDETVQANILKQASKDGWNALMIVARYQPENLPKILEVIQKLDKTVQADILKQASTHGWNALMLVAKYTPENLPKILGIILQLEINEAETIINEPKKVLSFSKTLSALDQAINNKFQDLELELKCSLFLLRQDVSGFQKDASISAKSARLWAETQGLYDACKTIPTDLSGWSNLRQKLDKARSNLKGQAICLNHLERLEVALQEKLHQQEEDLLSQLNALEPSAPPYPKGEPSSFNMSNQKGDSDLDETLTMAYTFPEPPAEAYYVKYAEAQPTQGGGVDNKYPEAVLVQTNEQTEEYPPVTERANNMPLTSPAEELACMRETLPLAEQANQFNLIKQDQKKIKDLKTLFRTDLTAKRDFMMLELASKTEEFKIKMNSQKLTQNQQKNYHQAYEITEKLHKNLTQVITYLNPSSNSPQKLDEAKNLWQAFIKRSVSQLPPSLPKTGTILNEALMGYEPSFFSTLIQTIEIPVSSPFEGAADVKDLPQQTNQIMKNKLKEMKADGTLTLISQIKEESEISTNDLTPDHLTAYNSTLQENALTLAIKMRSRHLPSVVTAIKELGDPDRIQVLHVCNQKKLSLISPSQIIFSVCKGNLPAQRALYLLELERLVLSKANASVRSQLNTLLSELNNQSLDTEASKMAWINAIQTTRKTLDMPEKNNTGLNHWFQSALRFIGFSQTIHQTPEGYGIGLFKPTIRTLLDEMSTFPMTPDQSGRKK